MNSYPPELLAQLAPVMFAAGLDLPPPSSVPSTPQAPVPPPKPNQDPFITLVSRLRDALLSQRKVAIWQPEKAQSFQVILVDKNAQFPPRKTLPPEDPQYAAAHSLLSPLTPTSPLYPDGLIAPIWIRKHTTMVPSVFVLFLRIFEYPAHAPRSPLDAPDSNRDREREAEERKKDAELSADIAERKKGTNDRGIKLTVVLMASRRMLDDPSLDARLTYIRRQSGLDSRAALFVLSPVSQAELGDFVRSLQQALYEPALDYYIAHSKRVRRKRNRHSQVTPSYPLSATPLGSATIARPLRPEGWTVRYEYKMACFAEFRAEDEVALKHYQDAYSMLVTMFGSTAILPPRTKRWAEAKVLADCINVKVLKLYLYNNEHALALAHHSSHVRKFGDFSRGWGIGEETFEFWSWVARQHRVLAELLEQGTRSNLTIPIHKPQSAAIAASQTQFGAQRGTAAQEIDALKSYGINPTHALQHPGFYYYMAARCTEYRRERLLAMVEAELSNQSIVLSPGFANEKKVEHLVIILELYTKAYELFKKYSPATGQTQTQSRLTLWIAYRIAQTYFDSGKFDMAVRFFERIAKTYRREKWGPMLKPLLTTWYACAQQLGDVELGIRLLVEMMGHELTKKDEPEALEEDLIALLKSTVPTAEETMTIDLSESQSILNTNTFFWTSEVEVGQPAAFQLSLTAPEHVSMTLLPFTSVTLYFLGIDDPFIIRHIDSDEHMRSSIRVVSLGDVSNRGATRESEACLRWKPGDTVVFCGFLCSDVPRELKVLKVLLQMEEGKWKIALPFDPRVPRHGLVPTPRWLTSTNPPKFTLIKRNLLPLATVRHRPHNIILKISQESPAYINEDYPITIDITNADDRELDVFINILLQPTEIDDARNTIIFEDEHSAALIKGVHCGSLAPGVSVSKTLHLISSGGSGDRMVDISVQSRPPSTSSHSDEEEPEVDTDVSEKLRTIVVPTVSPVKVTQDVTYLRSLTPWGGLADMSSYDQHHWEERNQGEAEICTRIETVGPWSLEIENIELERVDNSSARVIDSFIDVAPKADMFPEEYLPGDEFSDRCRVLYLANDHEDQEGAPIPAPAKYVITWRRISKDGLRGPSARSMFSFKPLLPPRENLIALLEAPPTAKLHQPFTLTLTVRNHHPHRSANVTVHLDPDSGDGFVTAGLRSGRLPILMPGTEEKLVWRLIPLECGFVALPKIRVLDRRKVVVSPSASGTATPVEAERGEGEYGKVVDVRYDGRPGLDKQPENEVEESTPKVGSVFVLP